MEQGPPGPRRNEHEVALAREGGDGVTSRTRILDDLRSAASELGDHVGIGALGDQHDDTAAHRGAGDDGDRDRDVPLAQVL